MVSSALLFSTLEFKISSIFSKIKKVVFQLGYIEQFVIPLYNYHIAGYHLMFYYRLIFFKQIYEYDTVIKDAVDIHYPVNEMVCNSKIRSVLIGDKN